MKMTFTLPEKLARRFQATYPKKRQSKSVADSLARKLRADEQQLERACHGANTLKQVTKEMEDWERLSTYDK
jgi:hypothetical protein